MNFKHLYQKLMKTYTAKVFSSLIFLDISFAFSIISMLLCTLLNNESISYTFYMLMFVSIAIIPIIKIIITLVTFWIEKRHLKLDYDSIYINKKAMILETISIVIQLTIFLNPHLY